MRAGVRCGEFLGGCLFLVLLTLTGLALGGGSLSALARTRDPLSPPLVISPLIFYAYVYHPAVLWHSGALDSAFDHQRPVILSALLGLVSISGFVLGCRLPLQWLPPGTALLGQSPARPSVAMRTRAIQAGAVCGAIGIAAFLYLVSYSGGIREVFFRGKPFLNTPTGYVSVLLDLTFVGVLLLGLGWQGTRITVARVVALLVVASPQLVWALCAARRGPTFVVFSTLAVSLAMIRARRLRWQSVIPFVVVIGLVLLFLQTNRRELYRGQEWDLGAFSGLLSGTVADLAGDEFVCASAVVATSAQLERHYWGKRIAALLFVRPIPRQLWPDKYHDIGLGWMREAPGLSGIEPHEWVESVGFVPSGGSACGFVADLFLEFSWATPLACTIIGGVYGFAWWKACRHRGVWVLLYFELLGLSVFLISQSVNAWLFRVLAFGIPTCLLGAVVHSRGIGRRRHSGQIGLAAGQG